MNKILDVFKNTIEEHSLIKVGDTVVIGVSGGPDSLCLLHLFNEIKSDFSLEIIVVHLDHQFRGEASRKDALFVEQRCLELGIKAYIHSEDVDGYSKENNISFEEAGREIRYKLFEEAAIKHNANSIAVAQNKNDQAETVLMRLLRGSGIDGLSAISYKRDNIIRPLLDVDRASIEKYCDEKNLEPRIDKTNLEAIYHRNKIRLELIPYIMDNFNPNIIDTLWRSAKIFRDDKEMIDEITEETMERLKIKKVHSGIYFDKRAFENTSVGLKKRIIRKIISKVKGNLKDVSTINIQLVIDLIEKNKVSTRVNIIGNIVCKIGYDDIGIIDESLYRAHGDFEFKAFIGQDTYIDSINKVLRIEEVDNLSIIDKNNKSVVYIDADKLQGDIIVRNRRPGDRFKPIGMGGSQKIKDFYINMKIPSDERDLIPLICDEKGIVWIAGYRLNDNYKLDKDSKKALKIYVR